MKTNKKKPVSRDSLTQSIWQAGVSPIKPTPKFNDGETYDALIVGGGITGITAAIALAEAGKKCILAEAHTIGFGTTGGTTSHLNTMLDNPYSMIEKNFGEEGSKLAGKAAKLAISTITNNIKKYKIDCDFEYKTGYLFSQTEDETKELAEIYDATKKAGVAVKKAAHIPVPIPFEQAIAYEKQGKFHPLKYVYALANEFIAKGGILLQNTLIDKTEKEDDVHVSTGGSVSIRSKKVIYATHIPNGVNLLHLRCAPYRSYVIAARLSDDNYPKDLAYDMKEPYHYYRTHEIDGKMYLVAGGEDHKTGHGDPAEAFSCLEAFVREQYNVSSVDYKWSSLYFESADGLPYIGQIPGADEGVLTGTGYSGNGIIFGTVAGLLLADTVMGKENEMHKLFSPSRIKPVAGFTSFMKENADVGWHFIADRFKTEEIDSLKELETDCGKVVEFEDQKLAIYKDKSGSVHCLNPVCTHVKCIVNWNNAEKSWDCPCHGGRFDIDGKVLTGPVRKDLERVSL